MFYYPPGFKSFDRKIVQGKDQNVPKNGRETQEDDYSTQVVLLTNSRNYHNEVGRFGLVSP